MNQTHQRTPAGTAGPAAAVLLLLAAPACAQTPSRPLQECTREYQARSRELGERGVSAARFYHECWWNSSAGKPTSLPAALRPTTQAAEPGERPASPPPPTREAEAPAPPRHREPAEAARRATGIAGAARPAKARRIEVAAEAAAHRRRVAALAATRSSRHDGRRVLEASAAKARRRERVALAAETRRRNRVRTAALERRDARRGPERPMPAGLPAQTRVGRRAWVGSGASTAPWLAVVVGPLADGARKGDGLHCWPQKVMYGRDGSWGEATVCDASAPSAAKATWFVGYERVAARR